MTETINQLPKYSSINFLFTDSSINRLIVAALVSIYPDMLHSGVVNDC